MKRHFVSGGGRSGDGPEVEQPEGLRGLLWRLHAVLIQRVLERLESDEKVSPAWAGIAISLLKLNDIRVSKAAQVVVSGLQRLGVLAGALGQPFSPRPPTTLAPVTTTDADDNDNEDSDK